jgi:hypothetical protein
MQHVWRRGAYRVLMGKPEREGRLVRATRRWEDNIKPDLRKVGWAGMDKWQPLVNAVINLWVP